MIDIQQFVAARAEGIWVQRSKLFTLLLLQLRRTEATTSQLQFKYIHKYINIFYTNAI